MATEWSSRSVIELQEENVLLVEDGNHGEYRPRHHEFVDEGCAFIRAADMDAGRVLFDSAQRINETALARIRKGIGKPGDVLFSHKGTVGKLALVPDDSPPFVCSPQTTFWRTLDEKRLDRRFLFCFMRSHAFQSQWAARKGETDMADYVSLTAQRTFKVPLPPLSEQRAIAGVLGALDDKIEQNRRTAAKLEALARAIFRAWFVDFTPVHAKAAGATTYPGLPPAAFTALPTTFTDSRVGPIPEGWDQPAQVAELERKGWLLIGDGYRAKRSELADAGVPFIRAGNVNGTVQSIGAELLGTAAVAKAGVKRSQVWDTVFTSKGTVGRIGLVTPDTGDVVYAPQVCFWRAVDYEALSPFVLHLWMKSECFTNQWMSVKGQTDMADFVSLSDQRAMTMLVPPPQTQRAFDGTVGPLIELQSTLAAESVKLAAIRDYLLSRLLSGVVRVKGGDR